MYAAATFTSVGRVYDAGDLPLADARRRIPQVDRLAREIMTLPCDQRYDASDMDRVADCFLEAR